RAKESLPNKKASERGHRLTSDILSDVLRFVRRAIEEIPRLGGEPHQCLIRQSQRDFFNLFDLVLSQLGCVKISQHGNALHAKAVRACEMRVALAPSPPSPPVHELRYRDAQRLGDALDVAQGRVALATFDPADIRSVKTALSGKPLLREPLGPAKFSDTMTEAGQNIRFIRHRDKVRGVRMNSPRTMSTRTMSVNLLPISGRGSNVRGEDQEEVRSLRAYTLEMNKLSGFLPPGSFPLRSWGLSFPT